MLEQRNPESDSGKKLGTRDDRNVHFNHSPDEARGSITGHFLGLGRVLDRFDDSKNGGKANTEMLVKSNLIRKKGTIQEANKKETDDCKLLSKSKSKFADFNNWQDENNDIHYAVSEDSSKEELRLIDGTVAFDRLVPKVSSWETLKRNHKGPEYNPRDGDAEHDLNRKPDRRRFEKSPVEDQDGELGACDRKCITVLGTEHEKSCIQINLLPSFFIERWINDLTEEVGGSPWITFSIRKQGLY